MTAPSTTPALNYADDLPAYLRWVAEQLDDQGRAAAGGPETWRLGGKAQGLRHAADLAERVVGRVRPPAGTDKR